MKVNVRLLIILVVIGFLTLGTVFGLHRYQMTQHAAGFLERARQGVKSDNVSDIRSGMQHYGNYLRLNPNDADVLAEYGILLKKQGNPKAFELLEKAVRGNPNHKEALQALADIMMFQVGRFADARRHLESLSKLEPKNTKHREQIAKCLIQEGDLIKAEETLQKIIAEDPTQLMSYRILSELYDTKLNRAEDAQKLMDQMVEKNPENAEAYRVRAIHFYSHKKEEEAQKDVDKALELAPKDKEVLLLASNFAKSKGDIDQARKFCQDLIDAEPKSQEGYLQMAMLEGSNLNFEKSLQWLDKGIQETGGTPDLYFQKADRLLDLGKTEDAEQEIAKLTKAPVNPILISYLEARVNYAKGNWAKAKDQFEAIRPDLNRTPNLKALTPRADLFTAECYRQLGNPEKGLELTNRAQRSDVPTITQDPLQEGRILRQEGKLGDAIAYFKQLIERDPTEINAHLELFPLLIQQTLSQDEENRDWSEVDSTLVQIDRLLPDDPRTALLHVQAIIAKDNQNVQEAEAVLDEAAKRAKTRAKQWDKLLEEINATSNSSDAAELLKSASTTWGNKNPYMEKGIEFIDQGNRQRALQILEAGRDAQADTQRLWLTRIAIARSQKDWDRAEEVTRSAIQTAGDSSAFRKALAAIIVERDEAEAPARLETVLVDIDKLPEDQQQDLWKFVAVLFNRLGKSDRAIELCEIAAKQKPNDLFIRRTLFGLALEAGNKEVVDKTLAEIGTIEQKGPHWNYLMALKIAYPLLDKKTLSEEELETIEAAIDHLRAAEVQRPNWGSVSLLLGRLYDKTGDTQAATTNLAQAVEFGERDPVGLARLAELYIRAGRSLEAQTTLDMMRHSSQGLNPAGLIAMAKMKLQQGDKRGAVAELMGAVELLRKEAAESNVAKTYLELAQVLSNAAALSRDVGQTELADSLLQEAKDMIVKASETEPSDFRPWLILAKLYKDQDKNQEVDDVIVQIKNNVPEPMQQLALALCYETLNRTVEAELAGEKALLSANEENDIAKQVASFYLRSERDQSNQSQKAEGILRKIIEGKLPAKQEDVTWARRRLSLILFARGLQKDRNEAMKLIGENLNADSQSLPDLRIQARGLAIKGTRKDKQTAIDMLENLIKRPNASSEDRYQLAKLYWITGNWNGVSQQMQVLLGSANPSPEWYEFYIQCLISRKEFSSAQTNWEKLKSLRPNTFATAELEAFILAGTNRPDKAIAEMETFLKNAESVPDNELVKLTLAAKTGEKLADLAANEGEGNQNDGKSKAIQQQYLDFAEKCYRVMAEKHEKYEMTLASFLGRHGKRDEAIDMADKAWKTNKPEAIAAATVRLLNTGDATPKQIERVEQIVNKAAEHFGDRISLDLALAELRTLQKRYDDAEKLYREVLKTDSDNVIALNNLAVFLALRNVKLDDSLAAINKAIEFAGPQATLLDSRASVYLARGELQLALDDIDAALRENLSSVRYFHQAQIQMATGDKEAARKSMNEALNLGLRADELQPLERPAYRTLREALR